MFSARHAWVSLVAIALLGTLFSACGKLNLGGGGGGSVSSSTPSPTPTPYAAPCATQNPSSNVVLVAMASSIIPVNAPKYGTIGGYAVVTSAGVPAQAAVIDHYENTAGNMVPITSNNVLQFVNVDVAGVNHSAVGFKGDAFPHKPYAFPAPAASPTAFAVSNTALWSTGLVAVGASLTCFSQTFTLKPGTYFFGDLDLYNLGTFQNVLSVATPTL